MLKKLGIFLLFSCIFSSAQTHRFIYELQFKLDSTSDRYEKANMILDITPTEAKFYDYDLLRMDSINKATQRFGYQTWGNQNTITRERNSFKNKNYESLDEIYSYNTNDPITWKLSNETKDVATYHLQKATTKFGGRTWTAWFCKDIPYNEGPYKFRGLPGLIFQIYDEKNHYIYNMVQSKTLAETFDTSGIIENYGGSKPLEINFKTLQKKKLEYFNDPLRDFRLEFDEHPDTKYFYRGTQITSKDQLKGYEKQQQDLLRKENNPIEIDKAVHYPEK